MKSSNLDLSSMVFFCAIFLDGVLIASHIYTGSEVVPYISKRLLKSLIKKGFASTRYPTGVGGYYLYKFFVVGF